MEHVVEVLFKLDPHQARGMRSECLWAEQVDDRRFRLRNTPMYVSGVSFSDVVFARERRGLHYFSGVSIRGGHSTFRILVDAAAEKRFPEYWQRLRRLGCRYEGGRPWYAVDVPPTVKLGEVYSVLEQGEADGVWHFEEGHIGHHDDAA